VEEFISPTFPLVPLLSADVPELVATMFEWYRLLVLSIAYPDPKSATNPALQSPKPEKKRKSHKVRTFETHELLKRILFDFIVTPPTEYRTRACFVFLSTSFHL
jgi:hypothetical protein